MLALVPREVWVHASLRGLEAPLLSLFSARSRTPAASVALRCRLLGRAPSPSVSCPGAASSVVAARSRLLALALVGKAPGTCAAAPSPPFMAAAGRGMAKGGVITAVAGVTGPPPAARGPVVPARARLRSDSASSNSLHSSHTRTVPSMPYGRRLRVWELQELQKILPQKRQ